MKTLRLLLLVLPLLSTSGFADDVANFDSLLRLLDKGTCGDTRFWISSTGDKDVFDFNLLEPAERTPQGMILTSPAKLNSVMVHYDQLKNELIYSESDMVGWVNLKVSFSAATLTGIDLYKTLPGFDSNGVPNGFRYSEGPKCGQFHRIF